jgi:hypothetical protein
MWFRTYTLQPSAGQFTNHGHFPLFRDCPNTSDVDVSRVHGNDDPVSLTIQLPFYKRWWYGRSPHTENALTVKTPCVMRLLYSQGRDILYRMLLQHTFLIRGAPDHVPAQRTRCRRFCRAALALVGSTRPSLQQCTYWRTQHRDEPKQ